jgi:hypothetical protein
MEAAAHLYRAQEDSVLPADKSTALLDRHPKGTHRQTHQKILLLESGRKDGADPMLGSQGYPATVKYGQEVEVERGVEFGFLVEESQARRKRQ